MHRFFNDFGLSGGPHYRRFGAVFGTFSVFFGDWISGYVFLCILDHFLEPGAQKMRISGDVRCGLYIVNNGSDRMSAVF